jgi:hypothetical protein
MLMPQKPRTLQGVNNTICQYNNLPHHLMKAHTLHTRLAPLLAGGDLSHESIEAVALGLGWATAAAPPPPPGAPSFWLQTDDSGTVCQFVLWISIADSTWHTIDCVNFTSHM